jgi:hypothetical protein
VEANIAACAFVLTVSAASDSFGDLTIVTSADIGLARGSNLVKTGITLCTNLAVMLGASRTNHCFSTWAPA